MHGGLLPQGSLQSAFGKTWDFVPTRSTPPATTAQLDHRILDLTINIIKRVFHCGSPVFQPKVFQDLVLTLLPEASNDHSIVYPGNSPMIKPQKVLEVCRRPLRPRSPGRELWPPSPPPSSHRRGRESSQIVFLPNFQIYYIECWLFWDWRESSLQKYERSRGPTFALWDRS